MSVLGRLIVSIVGDNRELKKSLTDTEKQLNKQTKLITDISNKMATAGKLMTVGITLPILGIGTAMVKTAIDAVESENLFRVSMGNMEQAARDWSIELSRALGLNQYEIRKSVGILNVMFGSMGLAEEAAYGMATGLTELTYDMASFYNLRPEEAFQKLQAGITGEIEPLKRLGIVVNETAIKTYALKNGIIEQGETMTEQEKIIARYQVIMEATSAAQGDLARTMEDPANQLRKLRSQAEEAAISFGMLLLPAVSKVLGIFDEWAQEIQGLSNDKKKFIIQIGLFAASIGPATFAIAKMIQVVVGLRNAIIMLSTAEKTSIFFKGGGLLAALALAIIQTGDSVQYTGDSLQKLETIIHRAETGFDRLKKGNEEYNETVEKAQTINDELLLNIKELADTYPLLADEVIIAYESWKNGTITLDEYNIELRNLIDNKDDYIVKSGEFDSSSQKNVNSIEQLTDSLASGEISIDEYINSMAGMEGATDDTTGAVDSLYSSIFNLFLLTADTEAKTEAIREGFKKVAEATKEFGGESDEAKDAQEELIRILDGEIQNTLPALLEKKGFLTQAEKDYITELQNGITKAGEWGIGNRKEIEETAALIEQRIGRDAALIMLGFTGQLDELGKKEVKPSIDLDTTNFDEKYSNVIRKMQELDRRYLPGYSTGGIVGYAKGGIIGHDGFMQPLLKASQGLITPSYDNGGILSLLHKNEVVLNSKQTRNLAELIFGLANTKHDVGGGGVNYEVNITSPKALSESEITRQIDLFTRELSYRLGY